MSGGHGGKRPGAGRPRKVIPLEPVQALEPLPAAKPVPRLDASGLSKQTAAAWVSQHALAAALDLLELAQRKGDGYLGIQVLRMIVDRALGTAGQEAPPTPTDVSTLVARLGRVKDEERQQRTGDATAAAAARLAAPGGQPFPALSQPSPEALEAHRATWRASEQRSSEPEALPEPTTATPEEPAMSAAELFRRQLLQEDAFGVDPDVPPQANPPDHVRVGVLNVRRLLRGNE